MIIRRKDRPSLDDLFLDLNHPNPNINSQASIKMRRFWPTESKDRLIQNLDSKNVQLRRKSVKAISYFGTQIVDDIIELYLSSENKTIRISCIKILVLLASKDEINGHKRINEVIKSAIKDDSPEILLAVISLLRQIGKDSIPMLKLLCRDENLLIAKASITALSEISDSKSCSFLRELADDHSLDIFVRESAIEHL